MRTECKHSQFEFHGLFQRKVKARFDGGKITSDAGVLLLREVELRTGLVAGLTACFRDHRDPLLRTTVKVGARLRTLSGARGCCKDHVQLRTSDAGGWQSDSEAIRWESGGGRPQIGRRLLGRVR